MDFKEYNKFVEIVKEQIECAKETTKILQESHRDLHKVGSNFPIRRPQQNQQQNQQQQVCSKLAKNHTQQIANITKREEHSAPYLD